MYKCKFCSHPAYDKEALAEHLRLNHPDDVSHHEDDDSLLSSISTYIIIETLIDSPTPDPTPDFSGNGGDFGGAGSSGDFQV